MGKEFAEIVLDEICMEDITWTTIIAVWARIAIRMISVGLVDFLTDIF